MKLKTAILFLILFLWAIPLQSAQWMAHPLPPHRDANVQCFRKKITPDKLPENFVIHITADNRYQLFLNGRRIGEGPARSPLTAWEVDRYDLAPFLIEGENQLAILVWNYGTAAGIWQQSYRTGLMISGDTPNESAAEGTAEGWRCSHSHAFQPLVFSWRDLNGYYAAGPGEFFDSRLYEWDWMQPNYDDSTWVKPLFLGDANAMQLNSWIVTPWLLKPRSIPILVREKGLNPIKGPQFPLKIAPFQTVSLLLDMGEIITAFPELHVQGGRDASIKLTYAETLFKKMEGENKKTEWEKGNRDQTEGKIILGLSDRYIADGSPRIWSPLFWRCWRYLQLDIQNQSEELTLTDWQCKNYSYPLKLEAALETGDPLLQKIWETGWRTFSRCSNETFFDCPYYEQLNYGADARIEALVGYLHTRDTALTKRSIDLLFTTTGSLGLMQNRSPTHIPQYLPTWSLDTVQMLYDLWMWRGEEAFIKDHLKNVSSNLNWFQERINPETGMLIPLKWVGGSVVEPAEWNGPPERITLEYLLALRSAALLENGLGSSETAERYQLQAASLTKALKKYWPSRKHAEDLYLEQVIETYAVLAEIQPIEERRKILAKRIQSQSEQVLKNNSFFASYYWLYYFHEALYQNEMADEWLNTLEPWKQMLNEGLTTWAESYPPTRSDCHGWSCSPSIHFFTTLCGIRPASPGFKTISFRPSLGSLQRVRAKIPHPDGDIEVMVEREADGSINKLINKLM